MEKKIESDEITDWSKNRRIYINNNAREETRNILETIFSAPVINIILEYGFSWYIDILTNEKILRNVDFNELFFDRVDDFRLGDFSLWHFIDLFCEMFPDERKNVYDRNVRDDEEHVNWTYPQDKIDYMTGKLRPYIIYCPIHSPDINKIVITINYSDLLKHENKIDPESDFVALDNMLNNICQISDSVRTKTRGLFKIDYRQYIEKIFVNDNSCIDNETIYINYVFTGLD